MLMCHLCIFCAEVSVQAFCPFLNWVAHFLKSSCVFWVTALYQMRLCRYFLLVFGLSSHSFNSVFTEQKFLILVSQIISCFLYGLCSGVVSKYKVTWVFSCRHLGVL